MRARIVVASLLASLVAAGCGDDADLKDTHPDDGAVSEVFGVDVGDDADTTTNDTDVPVDSGDVDSSASDTGAGDTGTTDSTVSDTSVADTGTVDSAVADTSVGDTFVADTFVPPDSGAPDTFVADTFVPPDSGAPDTFVADTFVPPDSGSPDTFVADTFAPPDSTMADTFVPDTFVPPDSSSPDTAATDTATTETSIAVADAGAAKLDATTTTFYAHTITIDGTNDFTASETFGTTSSGYTAYVTWDTDSLYVGYDGADVASTDAHKYVFIYLDIASGGSAKTQTWGTQQHDLPFAADAFVAWRVDGGATYFRRWDGASSWIDDGTVPVNFATSGSFVELSIPMGALSGTKLGVTTYMVNDVSGGEWTYAGLYGTSFTDGYSGTSSPITIKNYLDAWPGSAAPNDGSRKKP